MIRDYTDHAANERTFLAWVRTGVAVIAFGFVIEKFNVFVLTMASVNGSDVTRQLLVDRMTGPLGRYDGLSLILAGIAVIIVGAVRFRRTSKLIEDPQMNSATSIRTELIVLATLTVLIAGLSTYLALG